MPVTTDDPRRRLGALGEQIACDHLTRAGYEIIERNARCRLGELDIIAVGPHALVFCEVKTRVAASRSGPATPLEAIGKAKQRRIRLLAREWLANGHSADVPRRRDVRFDAIGVIVDPRGRLQSLEHVEGAF